MHGDNILIEFSHVTVILEALFNDNFHNRKLDTFALTLVMKTSELRSHSNFTTLTYVITPY